MPIPTGKPHRSVEGATSAERPDNPSPHTNEPGAGARCPA